MDYFYGDDTDDLRRIRAEILKHRTTQFMNDRERAAFMGLPETTRMRENAKILKPENFKCGHHVWIGEGAILDAQGGLEIGNYCQIGLYVMIFTHVSHLQAIYGETGVTKSNIEYAPTKIGNNCFIAGHTVISAGVTIGNNVIVSPMSFIDQDLPDNTVYSNNQKMKKHDIEIKKLKKEIEELKALLKNKG